VVIRLPMLTGFLGRRIAAVGLVRRMARPATPESIRCAREALSKYPGDMRLLSLATDLLTAADESAPLDEPRDPNDPAASAAASLRSCLRSLTPEQLADPRVGGRVQFDLGCALRLLGRDEDDAAQTAFRAALATAPRNAGCWYGFGLCHKYRGRWTDGTRANERALEQGVRKGESALWNLGICATGEGDTRTACVLGATWGWATRSTMTAPTTAATTSRYASALAVLQQARR